MAKAMLVRWSSAKGKGKRKAGGLQLDAAATKPCDQDTLPTSKEKLSFASASERTTADRLTQAAREVAEWRKRSSIGIGLGARLPAKHLLRA
jgi:hypothetical protein